jgi:autotransporter-associated beta strand protein
VTGFVGGDTVGNATSGTLLFSTSAASSSNVGSYAINGGGLTANYGNYAFVQASANSAALTINKATLTVTGGQIYDGTTTFQGANLLVSGVNGQTFTATGNAELATRNVQVNQQLAGIGGLTLTPNSGASLSNYNSLSTTNTSVSVTPRSITITAPVVEKTYDAYAVYNPTAADLTQMSSALVAADVVNSASTQFASVGAGVNKTLQLLSVSISDGNSGNNYSVTLQNSTTNVINRAALRITAANDAKFVTQTDAAGAANNCGVGVTCVGGYGGIIVNGLVNGETVADLTGSAAVTRTNFNTNSANFYPGVLRPSGYSSNNYNITYLDGDYTIVPAQQLLVKIIPQSITYGNTVNYTGNLSAKYLAADNSTIVSLTPVINGAQVSLNDGVGGTASFTVSAAGSSTSSSGYTKVGGYNFVAIDTVTTGANFSNNLVLVGSLAVAPIMMTTSDLGVSGVTKTYDGRASINGLALEINPNLTQLLPNDVVSVLGTGTFNNQDVGTSKPISVNVALSGLDAGNYAMSSTTLAANIGTINQLGSVTWVGPSTGGVWSDSSNWLGGATPTLSNVAQVVIPEGKTVVYDSSSVGQTLSTIVNNGIMSFNGASSFTLANVVSGSGSINLSGTGVVTISGNNTFTGGVNINASSLIVGSANALGAGLVTSSGGDLSVSNGVTLPALNVNGSVSLSSTIRSAGSQTYAGAVTLAGGSSNSAMRLVSDNADVNFMSTLNSDASNRSLSVEAGAGVVSFGDKVGVFPLNYAGYTANGLGANIHDLTVEASNIVIKGDINTLNTQVYRGPLTISDNGSNGLVRKLLSIDPSITITNTIDDVTPYTHSLYIAAASLIAANLSVVDLQLGAAGVGARVPLLRWEVYSGLQDSTPSALMGTIAQGQAGTITFNGSPISSGSYVADSTNRGTSGSGGGTGDGSVIPTTVSRLVNQTDVSGLIVVPANLLADVRTLGSLPEAPLIAPMRAMQLGEFERPFTADEPDAMSVTISHVCENDKTKPLHESCSGN